MKLCTQLFNLEKMKIERELLIRTYMYMYVLLQYKCVYRDYQVFFLSTQHH